MDAGADLVFGGGTAAGLDDLRIPDPSFASFSLDVGDVGSEDGRALPCRQELIRASWMGDKNGPEARSR
jgi:hypothetical protein